jgi:glutamyl-tRNA synthetase
MYWQKMAVQSLDVTGVWRWLGEHIENMVPETSRNLFAQIIKMNIEFPHDAALWAKILFHDHAPIDESEANIIREAGEQFFVEAELAVEKYGIDLAAILAEMKQTLGIHGKKLFMPLRVALTGKTHGPELAHVAELLGTQKMKHRLSRAFKLASANKEKQSGTE